jgi:hypothetical protein
MVQLARAIAEGEVKMTLSDLDLEAFLSDEPESRHELVVNDVGEKSDFELLQMVENELTELRRIEIAEQRSNGRLPVTVHSNK